MKHSSNVVVTSAPLRKRPDDPCSLPVLTDVLVPARSKSGRTLWLAWDERRVPQLDDVVAEDELSRLPVKVLRRRSDDGGTE
jgi:hypothetical protein